MSNSRILPEFELLVPGTIDEAVALAGQYGAQAAVLAGGTDLIIMLEKEAVKPAYVLALGEIPGLDAITYSDADGLRIGAMATVYQVLTNDDVKKHYPALWQAASTLGSPQIRNAATIVGNILRASPSGDCCCAMLALGGSVVLRSAAGERAVEIDDFFQGYQQIDRRDDEIAVELRLPPAVAGRQSAFMRLTRMEMDLSKVSTAVAMEVKNKKCTNVRIAMGAVAPTPVRLEEVEQLLEGKAIDAALLDDVAALVPSLIKPIDDVRSTADYRREVGGVLVKRALQQLG